MMLRFDRPHEKSCSFGRATVSALGSHNLEIVGFFGSSLPSSNCPYSLYHNRRGYVHPRIPNIQRENAFAVSFFSLPVCCNILLPSTTNLHTTRLSV